jgi:hypothetical protein
MDAEKQLKIGSFYWVIPTLDPDADEEWEHEAQPARYAGDGKWNCLNIDGKNSWPMRFIGHEITENEGGKNA